MEVAYEHSEKERISNLLVIDDLPICTEISIIEGGYETLWTSVFVKPLAWLIVNIGKVLWNNYGLAIIIITIDIPVYWGADWEFVGIRYLFFENIPSIKAELLTILFPQTI